MYIMDDMKLVIILVLCLVILAMLFFNTKEDKEVEKKEVVYVQNNPFPLWYYRTGPIWRPPFRFRRRRFR